jgi:hypothetical protein
LRVNVLAVDLAGDVTLRQSVEFRDRDAARVRDASDLQGRIGRTDIRVQA